MAIRVWLGAWRRNTQLACWNVLHRRTDEAAFAGRCSFRAVRPFEPSRVGIRPTLRVFGRAPCRARADSPTRSTDADVANTHYCRLGRCCVEEVVAASAPYCEGEDCPGSGTGRTGPSQVDRQRSLRLQECRRV